MGGEEERSASESVRILVGDARTRLSVLPDASVQTVVTSPPYFGLRDYGVANQIGSEQTLNEFIRNLRTVFREVWRVLRPDGALWLNIGDSYGTGAFSKSLIGQPWALAFALRDDGWIIRSDVIWSKPNPMPESVTDRPTTAHEHIFLLTKGRKYYFNQQAISEPAARAGEFSKSNGSNEMRPAGFGHTARDGLKRGIFVGDTRNARNVWEIAPQQTPYKHFAAFPEALAHRCISATSREGDTVLDPFLGSGTTALVAAKLQRAAIGCELSRQYAAMAAQRISDSFGLFAHVSLEQE